MSGRNIHRRRQQEGVRDLIETIQNFSLSVVHNIYLTRSLEALQVESLEEFVTINIAEEGITFIVSKINNPGSIAPRINNQASIFWKAELFENYIYNNNISGQIRIKVHLGALVSVLKSFDTTLLHENAAASWSFSYDGSIVIKTSFFGRGRKESRLTTSLINDEDFKLNSLNDKFKDQNTLYEFLIKSKYLKQCLANFMNTENITVKITSEAANYFLIMSAITAYGKKECKARISSSQNYRENLPFSYKSLLPNQINQIKMISEEINSEIIIKENGMMLIKTPINEDLNVEYILAPFIHHLSKGFN